MRIPTIVVFLGIGLAFAAQQQAPAPSPGPPGGPQDQPEQMEAGGEASGAPGGLHRRWDPSGYILGPGDQITIRAAELEEINEKPVVIDTSGLLHLPLIDPIQAAGLTVGALEIELENRLKKYLVHPDVSVSVTTFKSQPVTVVGAVKTPGVYQVEGRKTVMEMLSLAGGVDTAVAGTRLKLSRRLDRGRIPLKNAADDPTGQYSVATLNLKSLLEARDPADNIPVRPHDVITVPRAEMVYVIGQVLKAGGFSLSEHENITILKALSLAGGFDRAASPGKARILRPSHETAAQTEIPVDIKAILSGKALDVAMHPEDILFIPGSTPKKVATRTAEAALQIGTGIAIFGR